MIAFQIGECLTLCPRRRDSHTCLQDAIYRQRRHQRREINLGCFFLFLLFFDEEKIKGEMKGWWFWVAPGCSSTSSPTSGACGRLASPSLRAPGWPEAAGDGAGGSVRETGSAGGGVGEGVGGRRSAFLFSPVANSHEFKYVLRPSVHVPPAPPPEPLSQGESSHHRPLHSGHH